MYCLERVERVGRRSNKTNHCLFMEQVFLNYDIFKKCSSSSSSYTIGLAKEDINIKLGSFSVFCCCKAAT